VTNGTPGIQVHVDKAKKTISITMPYDDKGTPSSTGKMMLHASTGGFMAVDASGKSLRVNVMVGTKS
jgi:hypothetical protein